MLPLKSDSGRFPRKLPRRQQIVRADASPVSTAQTGDHELTRRRVSSISASLTGQRQGYGDRVLVVLGPEREVADIVTR